ncbi:MAG: DUF4153 domain-containing protein [Erysipelotrichaceae bacterium]|nr:DUF4153 domain-containing protein [Erysipelotrichaceae bacterium]MDD3810526.1 DUF4153 domain-containing protein [Erysipelotrichaceae bacterium]
MEVHNSIIENIANPHELERIFRDDPEAFRRSFAKAWDQEPDSPVLAVWNERLNYQEVINQEQSLAKLKKFLLMGGLAILAGISTRLIFHFVESGVIAPVNLVFGILPFIAAYFIFKNIPAKKIIFTIVLLFVVSGIYLNLLPLESNDGIIQAYLHLPVFLWLLVGLAYVGDGYKTGYKRLEYLRFNGEFCIIYASMAISGMLLFALTIQLFNILGLDISEFYFKNVILFGAASLAVVAAHLVTRNLKLARDIAPSISRIFSPLVLVTLIGYLATVALIGKNPFVDRDFLIVFNGILLVVLAVTIFSLTARGKDERRNISDFINYILIVLALTIDSVALSAVVFRISSYGITPNRMAVLGVNILIWINLLGIMLGHLRFLKNQTGLAPVQDAISGYLQFYGLWAAFVTFAFPLIF